MKSRYLIAVLSMVTISLMATASLSSEPSKIPEETLYRNELARSINSFSFATFKKMCASERGNLFISPLSISYALGMTFNGASGSTRSEMKDVLMYSELSDAELNMGYMALIRYLENLDPDVRLAIANSIWYNSDFTLKQEFIQQNKQAFEAEIDGLDFSRPSSVDRINDWVADNTNGKIEQIVSPPLSPDMVLFLINAVYFNGTWQEKFDPARTREEPFYLADGDTLRWKMMNQTVDHGYLLGDTYQSVDLGYGDGNYRMALFVPHDTVAVGSFVADFNQDFWQNWLSGRDHGEVILTLPRIKLSYSKILNDILIAMGIERAFSAQMAEFDKISNQDIFIDQVLHKTFVQVDEKGTEAAAATSVGMALSAAPMNKPVTIRVDRPYVFTIYEVETETILFMGKVMQPVWEE
ncbi:MAG: serpin family protein [candidate division Zixibacteria bacterium]|nr:serpin family protein [candidate division Zixibacteria bacterium]